MRTRALKPNSSTTCGNRFSDERRDGCDDESSNTVSQILAILLPVIFIGVLAWNLRRNPPTNTLRGPFPAAKKVWKIAAGALWAMGMISILAFTYLWYDYQDYKPRVQEPTVGRVYRKSLRGVTVYLTEAEEDRLNVAEAVSFACILGCFVVFGIMQREQRRVDEKRYERPS